MPKRGLTQKGVNYFKRNMYRAWRAIIRGFRMKLEEQKSGFNDARFLILTNPIRIKPFQRRELRRALKKFPFLWPNRRIMVKFSYQFRVAPAKRAPLKFLLRLISEESHPRLKSAIKTLVKHEKQVFRFQVI